MGNTTRTPTVRDILTELRRELHMRATHYPTWIASGKILEGTARHRLACIEEAIRRLETESQMGLFDAASKASGDV